MAVPDYGGLLEAMQRRVDATLDACTRCGKCVQACPMVAPAGLEAQNGPAIVEGILDLIAGGAGTPDAERWAQVCTNSGKCIRACDYGVNPRFMVNMARVAAKAKAGEEAVRRAGQTYFSALSRGTRLISRLQLAPEVLAKVSPTLKRAEDYTGDPDIVFYTGCNVIRTPHIALLVLEVMDALGVRYEVMGGTAVCCGIQHFKQGDAKTAARISFNTIERLGRPGAARVITWCPSCQIQINEFALPAYRDAYGEAPFDMNPLAEFFAERLDELRPHFVHRVEKRVAIQERAALPGIMTAVKQVLRAIPVLEVVELDVPVVSTQARHLSVLPEFKAQLRERELRAAAEAGITTFASIFHNCHRDLIQYQPQVTFELVNFMELIGEAMGFRIPDLYKRMRLMGDVDAVVADSADMIAEHGLDLEQVREVIATEVFGGKLPAKAAAAPGRVEA